MQIRPLDVDDDAEFDAYYRAAEEAERHQRPWAPFWSAPMLRAMFRADDPTERAEPFAAFEGTEVLGTGTVTFPLDADERHPHRRFAAEHGFTLGNAEIRRLLELPVPDPVIQAWVDEAAPLHPGYRVESYVDEVPEPLLASYVELLNRLNTDAPTGDIDFAAGGMTVATYLESERQARDSGWRSRRPTCACSRRRVPSAPGCSPPTHRSTDRWSRSTS
jgi:hypothetical protein